MKNHTLTPIPAWSPGGATYVATDMWRTRQSDQCKHAIVQEQVLIRETKSISKRIMPGTVAHLRISNCYGKKSELRHKKQREQLKGCHCTQAYDEDNELHERRIKFPVVNSLIMKEILIQSKYQDSISLTSYLLSILYWGFCPFTSHFPLHFEYLLQI